jgi:hypothetical protein
MTPIKNTIVLNVVIPNEKKVASSVIIVDASYISIPSTSMSSPVDFSPPSQSILFPSTTNEHWYTKEPDGTIIVISNSSDIPLFLSSQSNSPSQIFSRNLEAIEYGPYTPKDHFSRCMRYIQS